MGSTRDAKVLALIAAAPELAKSDDTDAFLDAMPVPELASMWCALQRLSRRDQTPAPGRQSSISIICRTDQPDRASISCSRCCAPKPTRRR